MFTWPGWTRAVPAFALRRSPVIARERLRCAQRMGVAIGEWPAEGPSLADLRAAFAGITVEQIDGVAGNAVADLFYAFAANPGTVKACVQALDQRLQVHANTWRTRAIVLAAGDTWVVRLVEWWPDDPPEQWWHTHPFGLLTYGLVSSGYTTEIVHVNPADLARARVGDPVEILGSEGLQRLHQGRRLYYPPHVIAHRQLPAADYSISLNLIIDAEHVPPLFGRQVFIDATTRCLMSRTGGAAVRHVSVPHTPHT